MSWMPRRQRKSVILSEKFSSSICAPIVQLCVELATIKKGDLSEAYYFCKIKNLASKFVVADVAFCDKDALAYLLAGLPSDYDPFNRSITTKDLVSLDNVYAHLITFEVRKLLHHTNL